MSMCTKTSPSEEPIICNARARICGIGELLASITPSRTMFDETDKRNLAITPVGIYAEVGHRV